MVVTLHSFDLIVLAFGISEHQRPLHGAPWQNFEQEPPEGPVSEAVDDWADLDEDEQCEANGHSPFWKENGQTFDKQMPHVREHAQ